MEIIGIWIGYALAVTGVAHFAPESSGVSVTAFWGGFGATVSTCVVAFFKWRNK